MPFKCLCFSRRGGDCRPKNELCSLSTQLYAYSSIELAVFVMNPIEWNPQTAVDQTLKASKSGAMTGCFAIQLALQAVRILA